MSIQDEVQPYREPLNRHVTFLGRAVGNTAPPLLEGVLQCTLEGTLQPGIVLCHANPAAGGNMDMKVMLAIEKALASAGCATLRYNSRGVGNSEGTITPNEGKRLVGEEGEAEVEDVGAALDFLAGQEGVDSTRLALVGHSFGARVSMVYVQEYDDPRVRALVLIGLPVGWRDLSHLGRWPHPRFFITGEHDDFCPPAKLSEYVSTLPEPKTLLTLLNTGHFFEGREGDLALAVRTFLSRILS